MTDEDAPSPPLYRRHVGAGLAGLAVFVVLGLGLEALHAYKVAFYLSPEAETRRLLLRLGHAHGTLLAIVNLLYGLVAARPGTISPLASRAVLAASILVPLGFLGGAFGVRGSDPGLLVFLAPAGGVLLVLGLGDSAIRVLRPR